MVSSPVGLVPVDDMVSARIRQDSLSHELKLDAPPRNYRQAAQSREPVEMELCRWISGARQSATLRAMV